jgi:hypothetical protein
MRIELVFERKIGFQTRISKLKTHILFHVGLYRWGEETHVSLERKQSTLEGGASSSTWVRFESKLPDKMILNWEKSKICSKKAYSAELKKHIYLWKKNIHDWR